MIVSNIFYSIQGEGPHTGTPSVFLRLSRCNLRCEFCDSKYTWEDERKMLLNEVIEDIRKYPCVNLVVTGGEPLLQQIALKNLFNQLLKHSLFYHFTVETNGTIKPDSRLLELVDFWIISPKLSNSGNEFYRFEEDYIKREKRGQVFFKFVVDNKHDLQELNDWIITHLSNNVELENIFLMPQAITAEEHNNKLPFIIDFAKRHGYCVSPRLQILAFGNVRGV